MPDRMKLRYTNQRGKAVDFTEDAPLIFLSQKGLSGMPSTALFTKSPGQIGKTAYGNSLDERVISLECALISADEEENEMYRRMLNAIITPLLDGTLEIIGNSFHWMCDCKVAEMPLFYDEDYTDFQNIMKFHLSLVCPEALLKDFNDTIFSLSQVEDKMEFPLIFIEEGIEFGSLNIHGVTFYNDGDAPAPLEITIIGPVSNPKVINETTGDFIEVTTPILGNEHMVITTGFGQKTVTIYDDAGGQRDTFHYINPASKFFSLGLGDNYLRFDAEVGAFDAVVNIRFKKQYLGV